MAWICKDAGASQAAWGNIPVASVGAFHKDPSPSVVRMGEKWRETLGQQSLQHVQRCFYHSLEGEDRKGSGCRPRAGARMGWGTMGRVCSGPEEAISPFWVPGS